MLINQLTPGMVFVYCEDLTPTLPRKLLFGRNKEEDGLIFKIIKYREIKKDDCQ